MRRLGLIGNEPFRFCVEEKEKGKSFGGGKQNLLHLPKIIFCWVWFWQSDAMRRGDQVVTNLIFDLPQGCHVLPASVSICDQMLDLGDTLLLFALLCFASAGWLFFVHVFCHKCMVLSSQGSIHPCSITLANVHYCSITFSNVHYCSITFSSVLLPVIQSAPSGQLSWQQVATQDIGPL